MFVKYEPNTVVFSLRDRVYEMTADDAIDLSRMFKIASEKARGPMPEDIEDQYIKFYAIPGF